MIMAKNIQIPQGQLSIPQAVQGLLNFMDQQMQVNKEVSTNLELIRYVLYEPEVRRRHGKVCMSAIM
jgi:hypothetical protein